MVYIKLIIMALSGTMIGWITNVIAIRLIFKPIKPVKIPLLNVYVQGLLPKRREEIAENIGKTVETELISYDDIFEALMDETSMELIKQRLKEGIGQVIEKRLSSGLLRTVKGTVKNYVENLVDCETEELVKDFVKKSMHEITDRINLSGMVKERINSFEIEYFEDMIITIVKKELRHLELLGAVLGLIIGIIQGAISVLM